MKYLKEFKDSEINRWKKIDDFGQTKGKSVEELTDEIEKVSGFPDGFLDGEEDGKPMSDEDIKNLYNAVVDDVKQSDTEDKEDDKEIDDSLRESRIHCFESFNDEIYYLDSIDEKKNLT